jgi:putative DNA primase/helicase
MRDLVTRTDYSALMPEVAPRLLGERNSKLSNCKEWRFGAHGSLAVNLEAGTWFDHELGEGGGVLDLIRWKANLRTNGEAVKWLNVQGVNPDAATVPVAQIKAEQAQREAEEARRAEIAAKRAKNRWSPATPAAADNPYLVKKDVGAFCARENKVSELLLPVTTIEGDLVSLQTIAPDGSKKFLPGGRKQGCMIVVNDPPGATRIVVAEGFATAATVAQAEPDSRVIAALDAGNLPGVVQALRDRYPEHGIVIAADHDEAGIKAAKEAAQTSGCCIALPPTPGHDWNDHAAAGGAVDLDVDTYTDKAPNEPTDPTDEAEAADEGQVGAEHMEAELERLAALSRIEYDRERKVVAKRLGLSVKVLDDEVKERQQAAEQETTSPVEEIEAWGHPVEGERILSEIEAILRRYCVLHESDYKVLPVMALATYTLDAFAVFPRGVIKSPQKRCGKTVLLETLESVTHRALMASGITPAAMFRVIDKYSPTLLIDEADTFMGENEELRGVINSSHRRRNASVIRTVGDAHEPMKFSTWAAMFIAGIGDRAETVEDRAIVFELRRKLPGETTERCPPDMYEQHRTLRRQCMRWAQDHLETLRSLDFVVPSFGNDRAADNWLPLFALARIVGGEWEDALLTAFRIKSDLEAESEAPAVLLLRDIRHVFDDRSQDRVHSETLIEELVELPGRPWAEWKHGKPMTPASLSRLLKPFKITPTQLRIGTINRHGYERKQFQDAWKRYVSVSSPDTRIQTATTLQSTEINNLEHFKGLQTEPACSPLNERKSLIHKGCSVVALSNGGSGEKESFSPENPDDDWEAF